MLARAAQGGAAVAVLLLDLDHFKRINDTRGRLAGDHVLAATAATLRRETRNRDVLGRFGEKEFAVAMVGLTLPDVLPVAERIRAAAAALKVDDATVTASIGVAYEPVGSNVSTPEQLLDERADAAPRRREQRPGPHETRASEYAATALEPGSIARTWRTAPGRETTLPLAKSRSRQRHRRSINTPATCADAAPPTRYVAVRCTTASAFFAAKSR